MDIMEVKNTVSEAYCMKICFIEKIRNVYRIVSNEKEYCLKSIKYNFSHFLFILSAIKHLQHRGFQNIPTIIKTGDNKDYLCLDGGFAYLTKWVPARQCNYDKEADVFIAAQKLGELHNKSEGFVITQNMQPRIGWLKWMDIYNNRIEEIVKFKSSMKENNSEFHHLYVQVMDEEIIRAKNSIKNISSSAYIEKMVSEIANNGFCHHDYAHHNVLLNDNTGEVNIIDFDYCMLDTHLHDLTSLMIRIMKNGKWSTNNALSILDAYSEIKCVDKTDIPIMAGFMEFPQDYWQVGIQYYLEKQPWGEQFFINKLKKILEDRAGKQEFIDEFRLIKYC